jgi:ATP-binding cassette subfamily B protein
MGPSTPQPTLAPTDVEPLPSPQHSVGETDGVAPVRSAEGPGDPTGVGGAALSALVRFWPLTRGDRRWLALVSVSVVVAARAKLTGIEGFGHGQSSEGTR